MLHPPLSHSLAAILQEEQAPGGLTLNLLIERTERRGLFLVLILLSLPFITPIPLPGLSNVIGFVILLLAIRLALRMPPYLPRFVGERKLSPERMHKVLQASVRFLRFMEKWVKPRRTDWLTWRAAQFGNALLLALMAFVLFLPIPPIVPFSNSLPSYAIILMAASMMEEDGLMIWLAYGVCLATLAYLTSMAHLIIGFFFKYYDRVMQWLGQLT